MNLEQFQLLPPLAQLFWTLKHGTPVASRPEASTVFDLYLLLDQERQFYVEVEHQLEADRKRSAVRGSFAPAALELAQRWR